MTTINVASLFAPSKTGGLVSENGEAADGVAAIFDAILSAISEWNQLAGDESMETSQDGNPEGEHPNAEQVLAMVISDDSVKPYLDEHTGQDLLPLLENILTLPEPKEAMLEWANQMALEHPIIDQDMTETTPSPLTETVMMKPLSDQNIKNLEQQSRTNDLLFQVMGNQKSVPHKMKNGYGEARHSGQILASLMRKTMPALDHALAAKPPEQESLPQAIYGPHPQQDQITGMSIRVNHVANSPAPELSAEHLYGPFERHSPMAKLTSQASMPMTNKEIAKELTLTASTSDEGEVASEKTDPIMAMSKKAKPSANGDEKEGPEKTDPITAMSKKAKPSANGDEKEEPEKTDPITAMSKKAKPRANDEDHVMPRRQVQLKPSETLSSVPTATSQTKAELMETRVVQIALANSSSSTANSAGASTEQGSHFGQQSGQQQGQNGTQGTDLDTRMGLDQGKDGRLIRLNMQQENWPDRLIRNIQSASKGNSNESIEVILEPKRLGRLVLKISMTGNVSSVSITSTSVEAATMLADPENRLQQIFEQYGMKLGQMNTSS
ncbi:MAG: flagellar hook-length control protein FliK, partial [Alphaproteobacteria bacterium]|nr:flagellar hook-length control protein FliK [Alphaproteobacteria bacterium]